MTKEREKGLLKRIANLERRVRVLEARQNQNISPYPTWDGTSWNISSGEAMLMADMAAEGYYPK